MDCFRVTKFPFELITKVNSVMELQKWIIDTTDSTIDNLIVKIKNSIFLELKNIADLVDSIISIAACRYDLNQVLVLLVFKLLELDIDQDVKSKIKRKLSRSLFKTRFYNYQYSLFIRKLYNNNFFENFTGKNIRNLAYKYYLFYEDMPKGQIESKKFIGENCYPKDSPMLAIKDDNIDALSIFADDLNFDPNAYISKYSKENLNILFQLSHKIGSVLTLIDVAAMFGSVQCFKKLKILGAIPAEMTKYLAICGGSLEIIRILESEGGQFKDTLVYAIKHFRNDLFDWILNDQIGGLSKMDSEDISDAFHNAAAACNYYALLKLYNDAIRSDYPNGKSQTALQMAIINHHLLMVKLLISADDFYPGMPNLSSPICWACYAGSLKMTRMIYEKCHRITTGRATGKSAVELAIASGNLKVVKFLIEETDAAYSNKHPFYEALKTHNVEIMKYIVAANICDIHQTNPLYLAVSEDHTETIEYVLSLCTEEELNDDSGFDGTPFQTAMTMGYNNSIKVMKKHPEVPKELRRKDMRKLIGFVLSSEYRQPGRKKFKEDKAFHRKIEKKIVKYGFKVPEILVGREIPNYNSYAPTDEWLRKHGLYVHISNNTIRRLNK